MWKKLLSDPLVKPAGLGARNILRLEAGLPLYGDELTDSVTPLDAGMEKYIDFEKVFTGKEALLKHRGNIKRILTGVSVEGRRTPRHTNKVFAGGAEAGVITSGVFSPHLNRGIGFMYIDKEHATEGREVTIALDRGEAKGVVTAPPFIKNTSIRYQEE